MNKEYVVLSLFDGMSGGFESLKRSGVKVKKYYASEIDKHAITIAKKNHPEIIHLGNILNWKDWDIDWSKIDLLIAGSPCQGFSKAGLGLNFDDPRSKLFFEFVEIRNYIYSLNPKLLWLLENVKMKKEYEKVISDYMSVEPIRINSKLVSAGLRDRFYWTNIEGFEYPKDREILLESILQDGDVDKDKGYCIDAHYFKGTNPKQYLTKSRRQIVWQIPEGTKKGFVELSPGQCINLTFIKSKTRRGRLRLEKSNCITAANYNYCKVTKDWFRLLTPIECERIMTFPDNYTEGVSNTQRYKMLGNGWNIETIMLFFKNLEVSK